MAWTTAGYDKPRVHPRLQALNIPYQFVRTDYFLDGGSIGITIVDRDGDMLQLALPVSAGRSYRQLFIGATHRSNAGAVEVPFSEDTRRMLISLVEQHRRVNDDSDIALLALRGAPRDYVRIAVRAVANQFR